MTVSVTGLTKTDLMVTTASNASFAATNPGYTMEEVFAKAVARGLGMQETVRNIWLWLRSEAVILDGDKLRIPPTGGTGGPG